MITGNVFNIEHFAIHDGPGIRSTVFLKGCPLSCLWCHNPEGLSVAQQIVHYNERCIGCGKCVEACPNKAITFDSSGVYRYDEKKCTYCGACVEVCSSKALELIGKTMLPEQVIEDVEGDRLFYEESGGGVTFSGGEPLLQWQFLEECLKLAKKRGLHTALETSGFAEKMVVERIAQYTDLFLYDLKHITSEGSKKCTGVDNTVIKDNLRYLSESGKRIILRIVVVPGVNDSSETIEAFCEFLKTLPFLECINLLPLHKSATEKYRRLGSEFRIADYNIPDEKKMENIADMYKKCGFAVKIGG